MDVMDCVIGISCWRSGHHVFSLRTRLGALGYSWLTWLILGWVLAFIGMGSSDKLRSKLATATALPLPRLDHAPIIERHATGSEHDQNDGLRTLRSMCYALYRRT